MSQQSSRKRKPFSESQVENGSIISSKRTRSLDEETSCSRRAGTINHIILKNFMCHSLLEVNFTNNISIIIGKNGSGKSAILTALVVGLGGKASLTNRGSSVKAFVKAGKTSGSVEIDLCNEGPMAYRPNIYGSRINIVRTVSASGSGSYRIRSETGEIVSTSAKEVQNITSSLNIQVDNPICILNQDTSRNFLSSNDPKHKFTLFMRATRLETLEAEYKKIQNNKEESVRIMEEKEDNFRKLQDEIKRLKKKIESHRSILNLKDRKALLQRELMWAKVRDVEVELEQESSNMKGVEKKMNDCKQNIQKRDEKIAAIQETIRSLEQQILEIKDQIEIQKRPQTDIKNQINEMSRHYSEKSREMQQIQTTIQAKTNDIKSLERDIAVSNENMSKVEQQKIQRMKDLAALQTKLKSMDDHLETSKNDLFQIKSDLARREEEEQNLRTEIRQIDDKIGNETTNLNALNRNSGNTLLLYGRDMPQVIEMIKQYKNKFKHEPRGPLGYNIKIKEKKWAVATEGYLGAGLLGAFAVDNNKDGQLLREIFNKVWRSGKQPQIITSKFVFKKHDVSRNLTYEPPNCISLYNALEINDPVVSNCIVDSANPENILLIPDDRTAIELLSNKQNVPRHCYQGVTIKGDRYYPDPNYRTYASQYHHAKYLQVDTNEYMRQLEQNIDTLNKKRQSINGQLQAFMADVREKLQKKNQLEDKVKKVNMARMQIRRQLEDLNATAEPEVQNVQYLEQELDELKRAVNEKSADLGKITEEIKVIKTDMTSKENQLSQLRMSTRGLEDRIKSLNDEVRENQTKQKEILTSEKFEKSHMERYEAALKDAKRQITMKERELKKYTDEASTVGERLPDLRSIREITNDINEIKNKISKIETDSENVNDIMGRYNELTEKCLKSSDIMKSLQADIHELSTALNKRNRHYKLTESYFVTYMKYSFKKILEFRQFKGTIEINMNEKKLDLIVIPQHGSQGLTTTSNLSGGERSFSTVAFLYSLWQCMEFPFYFLDEFDVYMDKLNRTKVIDILLHHAKSKEMLQFVFLTPQDVSFINKDVSILRLEDPKRFNN